MSRNTYNKFFSSPHPRVSGISFWWSAFPVISFTLTCSCKYQPVFLVIYGHILGLNSGLLQGAACRVMRMPSQGNNLNWLHLFSEWGLSSSRPLPPLCVLLLLPLVALAPGAFGAAP